MDDPSDTKRQAPPRRIELYSGAGPRRWLDDLKAQIVAESFAPGIVVTELARRHGCRAPQIHAWRKAARDGLLALPASDGPGLVPLLPEPLALRPPEARAEIIVEISGALVRVTGRPGAGALTDVFAALREAS